MSESFTRNPSDKVFIEPSARYREISCQIAHDLGSVVSRALYDNEFAGWHAAFPVGRELVAHRISTPQHDLIRNEYVRYDQITGATLYLRVTAMRQVALEAYDMIVAMPGSTIATTHDAMGEAPDISPGLTRVPDTPGGLKMVEDEVFLILHGTGY